MRAYTGLILTAALAFLAPAGCGFPGASKPAEIIRRAQPTPEELERRRRELEEEGARMDNQTTTVIEAYDNSGCVSRTQISNRGYASINEQ